MARREFKVLRAHLGDKPYAEGDSRIAEEGRVRHLIRNGVLSKPLAVKEAKTKKLASSFVPDLLDLPSVKSSLKSTVVKSGEDK